MLLPQDGFALAHQCAKWIDRSDRAQLECVCVCVCILLTSSEEVLCVRSSLAVKLSSSFSETEVETRS